MDTSESYPQTVPVTGSLKDTSEAYKIELVEVKALPRGRHALSRKISLRGWSCSLSKNAPDTQLKFDIFQWFSTMGLPMSVTLISPDEYCINDSRIHACYSTDGDAMLRKQYHLIPETYFHIGRMIPQSDGKLFGKDGVMRTENFDETPVFYGIPPWDRNIIQEFYDHNPQALLSVKVNVEPEKPVVHYEVAGPVRIEDGKWKPIPNDHSIEGKFRLSEENGYSILTIEKRTQEKPPGQRRNAEKPEKYSALSFFRYLDPELKKRRYFQLAIAASENDPVSIVGSSIVVPPKLYYYEPTAQGLKKGAKSLPLPEGLGWSPQPFAFPDKAAFQGIFLKETVDVDQVPHVQLETDDGQGHLTTRLFSRPLLEEFLGKEPLSRCLGHQVEFSRDGSEFSITVDSEKREMTPKPARVSSPSPERPVPSLVSVDGSRSLDPQTIRKEDGELSVRMGSQSPSPERSAPSFVFGDGSLPLLTETDPSYVGGVAPQQRRYRFWKVGNSSGLGDSDVIAELPATPSSHPSYDDYAGSIEGVANSIELEQTAAFQPAGEAIKIIRVGPLEDVLRHCYPNSAYVAYEDPLGGTSIEPIPADCRDLISLGSRDDGGAGQEAIIYRTGSGEIAGVSLLEQPVPISASSPPSASVDPRRRTLSLSRSDVVKSDVPQRPVSR